jgi:4-hydroxy-tetrahydrodipicolinate synthase
VAATRLDETAKGVFVIAATPFAEDGALDLESTDRLIDFYLDKRVQGLTILGIMGEAGKLTPDESVRFLRRVLGRVGGRVPVIVGVSSPGIANLAALAREAMDAGAAGVMVAPPAGLHTEEQVLRYLLEVQGALGPQVPLCFQDYPQATGVHVSATTVGRLVDACASFVVFKHEDCPGSRKLSQIRSEAQAAGRRRISILVGNGGLYLPQELARGADGAMTGFAFPEMLVDVCELFARGEAERAEDVFDTYLPLVRHEQQPGVGLALRKEVLRRRGAIRCAATRAPGPRLDADDHAELDRLLARLERRLRS